MVQTTMCGDDTHSLNSGMHGLPGKAEQRESYSKSARQLTDEQCRMQSYMTGQGNTGVVTEHFNRQEASLHLTSGRVVRQVWGRVPCRAHHGWQDVRY